MLYLPPKEHDSARIIQFIHLVEIRHLLDIDDIESRKCLDLGRDFVEQFIHGHALGETVLAESDHNYMAFFVELLHNSY